MTLAVIRLDGDLDFSRKAEIQRRLSKAEYNDIAVIDLTDAQYIDSSTLSCLAGLRQRMIANERAGIIRIVAAGRSVRRVFEICGLDKTFEMYATLAEANGAQAQALKR